MNTPELKAGQRFLSRLEADNEITEVTVKQATADGAFIKCSWSYRVVQSAFAAYDDRTQWFAAGELSVLHILEDGAEQLKSVTDIKEAETVQSDENSRLCFQPPSWDDVLKRNGNKDQEPPVTPTRPLLISASRVNTGKGKWFLRALIETAINGTIIRSAVESSDAEDETTETLISKLADLINRIPENIRYMANRPTSKLVEETAKEQP